jgi:hypothetical protein
MMLVQPFFAGATEEERGEQSWRPVAQSTATMSSAGQ